VVDDLSKCTGSGGNNRQKIMISRTGWKVNNK
jgi:hypothetical protein